MSRVNMGREPWQNYSSPRLRAKAPSGRRPGLPVQRFFFRGVSSCATVTRIGRAIIVEILHPIAGNNYTLMAKTHAQALENLESAFNHVLSLSMELQEVDK